MPQKEKGRVFFTQGRPVALRPAARMRSIRQRPFNRDDYAAYVLILPFFLFFLFFVAYPVLYTVWQSFTDFTGLSANRSFIGLQNYYKLTLDDSFHKALTNTVIYVIGSVPPLIILGFITAAALNRPLRVFTASRGILVFPYITSMVAVSMIWLMMFEPNHGVLNALLKGLGLPAQKWLFDPKLALACLIFVNIWKNTGYVMLIFLAGLQSIPHELYEAANVDGASGVKSLWHITFPMLRPITLFVSVTMIIESFKTFDQVRVMTDGNPLKATTTLVHQIYLRAFSEFKYGYASAMSVTLLLVILAVTVIQLKLTKEK